MKLEELEDIEVSIARLSCALKDLEEVEVRMSNLEFDSLEEAATKTFYELARLKHALEKARAS